MGFPLPSTQRALKVSGPGQIVLSDRISLPQIGAEDVLVRNVYIGLNPYDSKSLDLSASFGATVGGDFAGEIAAVGEAVTQYQIGDRVFGCVFGNNPDDCENGAFAEYVSVPAQLVMKLPPCLSFQQAATLGIGLATTGQALYKGLGLPMPMPSSSASWSTTPAASPPMVLVYGGGTATGALAIQVLRRTGFIPITTCSTRSFARVHSLGAEAAFDYHSPTCGADIREYTKDRLGYAMDCIADTASMKICYEAIGTAGGRYLALDPFPLHTHTRRSVQPDWLFLFTQFGKPVGWDRPYNFDARPRDRAIAERWYRVAEKLLFEGQIIPPPYEEKEGGLQAVDKGLEAVRKGLVSGYKLVYPISRGDSVGCR
ncbi:GroES-like protein [Aspergillus unguis]